MARTRYILCFLFLSATGMAADGTALRLGSARTALHEIMGSEHFISMDQLMAVDCVAVIPGFKKGAAVVGVGYGRGFISCRTPSGDWSAPGAISLESTSLGVQVGGEKIDIVIVSFDKSRRKKLLSDRFTIDADASAAWGNGKSAHEDPNAKILFFARTKGVFAGFDLDGATLKSDQSTIKALYGEKASKNSEIVDGGAETPALAKPFIVNLTRDAER